MFISLILVIFNFIICVDLFIIRSLFIWSFALLIINGYVLFVIVDVVFIVVYVVFIIASLFCVFVSIYLHIITYSIPPPYPSLNQPLHSPPSPHTTTSPSHYTSSPSYYTSLAPTIIKTTFYTSIINNSLTFPINKYFFVVIISFHMITYQLFLYIDDLLSIVMIVIVITF